MVKRSGTKSTWSGLQKDHDIFYLTRWSQNSSMLTEHSYKYEHQQRTFNYKQTTLDYLTVEFLHIVSLKELVILKAVTTIYSICRFTKAHDVHRPAVTLWPLTGEVNIWLPGHHGTCQWAGSIRQQVNIVSSEFMCLKREKMGSVRIWKTLTKPVEFRHCCKYIWRLKAPPRGQLCACIC